MAREPLLDRKRAAEEKLRLAWPLVWVADDDGKGLPPFWQPSPPKDSKFMAFAAGRWWADRVKPEWRDCTIWDVANPANGVVVSPNENDLLDTSYLTEIQIEDAGREIDLMMTCVADKHAFEQIAVKWCYSDREHFVASVKYATWLSRLPPARWRGVTYEQYLARASAVDMSDESESKDDDRV
mmetsp:Transcript_7000/g.24892  ORF Transcript_7000/g.24892 Transcript_7000/m.24892 type:complete len:183 (-) Transcript_7000:517-1065(-)